MHEIHVGVRLQQIAPHSFARMRLPGDQQNFELVANALDVDHGAIAVGSDFPFHGGNLEFDDVRAGMVDRRLHVDSLTNLGVHRRNRLSVAPHGELDRFATVRAVQHTGLR